MIIKRSFLDSINSIHDMKKTIPVEFIAEVNFHQYCSNAFYTVRSIAEGKSVSSDPNQL